MMIWGAQSQHYSKSPDEVRNAILSAKIQTDWLGETARLEVTQEKPSLLISRFVNHSGQASLKITSSIASSFGGTRVINSFEMDESALSSADKEALRTADENVLERYANEHIAAAVEDRDFDILALSRGFGALRLLAQFAPQEDETDKQSLEPTFPPVGPEITPGYEADEFVSDAELERQQVHEQRRLDSLERGFSQTNDNGGWGVGYD